MTEKVEWRELREMIARWREVAEATPKLQTMTYAKGRNDGIREALTASANVLEAALAKQTPAGREPHHGYPTSEDFVADLRTMWEAYVLTKDPLAPDAERLRAEMLRIVAQQTPHAAGQDAASQTSTAPGAAREGEKCGRVGCDKSRVPGAYLCEEHVRE